MYNKWKNVYNINQCLKNGSPLYVIYVHAFYVNITLDIGRNETNNEGLFF